MPRVKMVDVEITFKESIQRGDYSRYDELGEALSRIANSFGANTGWDFGTGCSALISVRQDDCIAAFPLLFNAIGNRIAGVTIKKVRFESQ